MVLLTLAVTDEGHVIPAGTEGTIVSVHGDGSSTSSSSLSPWAPW